MASILIRVVGVGSVPEGFTDNLLRIGFRADLYDAGRNEDGEKVIEEVVYLAAEDADGERWVGPTVADTAADGSLKRRGSEARKKMAAAFRAYREAVREGEFDPRDAWTPARPAYGSPAYVLSGGDEAWMGEDD